MVWAEKKKNWKQDGVWGEKWVQLLHYKGEPEASVLFTSHNHRIVLTFNIDQKNPGALRNPDRTDYVLGRSGGLLWNSL